MMDYHWGLLKITKLNFSSFNFYKTRHGFVAHFWKYGIYYPIPKGK